MRSASGQIPVLCPHCGDEPLRLREEVNGLPKATHTQAPERFTKALAICRASQRCSPRIRESVKVSSRLGHSVPVGRAC